MEHQAIPVNRRVYYPSPGPGQMAYANAFYTQPTGPEKKRVRGIETRSDTLDCADESYSADNGATWTPPQPRTLFQRTSAGVKRWYVQPAFADGVAGLSLEMVLEGTLPTDDPLEGMKHWYLSYRTSRDGGRTYLANEQVIQEGFDADHPFDGVWIGKNSAMIGDLSCRPIRTCAGEILVPICVSPVGPDGQYHNPGGGYTYHDAAALIGVWRPDGHIAWRVSEYVRHDPGQSTRGCDEPTLAELPDGRILMVIRGSNDAKPHLPGYRWFTVSTDGGRRFGPVRPWTYTGGTPFHSPASCSQLLPHSSGRIYWLGNIVSVNPRGNGPRYPLVMAEVDLDSGLLIRDSRLVVDDRQPGESDRMTLSNFMAHEDRVTRDIVLHMTRGFTHGTAGGGGGRIDFTGDAFEYRIKV